jgi:uncharacterized protein (UPF0335 family)
MTDQYEITADQLRSFIERYERLEAEKQDHCRPAKRGAGRGKGLRL